MKARPPSIVLLTAAFLICVGELAAAPVRIVRLWNGYREAASFLRLSEYLTGEENPGRAILLRTDPEVREGFYFTLRLAGEERNPVPDGRIVLQVVAPDAEKPRRFEFPFQAGGRRSVRLEIGLTGADWPYEEALPLAWQLEVLGSDGTVLASRASYLWAKPEPAPKS